jgi:predicted AAA+ superfamily ATPase
MYVKRQLYLDKIDPLIGKGIVKVLTGIRRCGKSVMLLLIQDMLVARGINQSQIITRNFDTFTDDPDVSAQAIYQSIKEHSTAIGKRLYLFFDEIQELNGWERLVNSCLTELDADIYVTGSNSKMLSREYATLLTGRYVTIHIYPFSFAEALQYNNLHNRIKSPQDAFNDYLIQGGMPFVYQVENSGSQIQYLRDLFDAIISKDITERYHVRDVDLLKRLVAFLASNIGNLYSPNNVISYLHTQGCKVSWETIANYVDYLKTAYLFLPAAQMELTGKQILRTQEKLYLADHGFRQAMFGKNLEDAAQLLENIVYLELLRNDYEVHIGKQGNQEVDFVAKKAGQIFYIQVCYLLATDEIVAREFKPLLAIKDNYPKLVLSLDPLDRSHSGIINCNLIDFLTGDNKVVAAMLWS